MSVVHRSEQILEAAARLFQERGFHGVGTAEIGREAGISGPAIYRHFQSKDEILAALVERAVAALLLRMPAPADDPWERLDAMVEAMVEWARAEREGVLVYSREGRFLVDPWRASLRRFVAGHLRRWEETVAACRPDLAPRDVTSTAWAINEMLLAIAGWSRAARDNPDLPALMRDLVRRGLHEPPR